jgi:hypothetical protein
VNEKICVEVFSFGYLRVVCGSFDGGFIEGTFRQGIEKGAAFGLGHCRDG